MSGPASAARAAASVTPPSSRTGGRGSLSLRPAGVGLGVRRRPRRAGGRAGRRRGSLSMANSSFLVPCSGGVCVRVLAEGRRSVPVRSCQQRRTTERGARGEGGGPVGTGGARVGGCGDVAAGRRGRRDGKGHDGAPAAAGRGAQGGVEVVVATGGAARGATARSAATGSAADDACAPAGHQGGRCRLGRRVRAGHDQDEQQDKGPQAGAAASDARRSPQYARTRRTRRMSGGAWRGRRQRRAVRGSRQVVSPPGVRRPPCRGENRSLGVGAVHRRAGPGGRAHAGVRT